MGQRASLPTLHPEQPSDDGLLVVSDVFRETGFCDDYDEFTESFLQVSKAPDMLKMPAVYKETLVSDNADDGSFEVKVIIDAARLALVIGNEYGVMKNKVVEHKVHKFDYERRTLCTVVYKDHWEDEKPEVSMQYHIYFGTPLRLEFYCMVNGVRYATDGIAQTIMPILQAVAHDINPSRLPEVKINWDPDRLCYYTGHLGRMTTHEALYSAMLMVIRESLLPTGKNPHGVSVVKYSSDHVALISEASRRSIVDNCCIFDRVQGYILRTSSSHVLPNIKFQILKSPLTMKLYFKRKDNTIDLVQPHFLGQAYAQAYLDRAIELSRYSASWSQYVPGMSVLNRGVTGCCSSRQVAGAI